MSECDKKLIEAIEGTEDSYIEYDIDSSPAFYTLEILAKYYDEKSKVFEIPDFQRKPKWDKKRQSKLIESFLMGLPVPPIFLFTENKSTFKVIDGVQRLHTIFSYLNGDFKLNGLGASRYNNKSIYDLDNMMNDENTTVKDKLLNVVLGATIVRQANPKDSNSMYEIFARLNTGGLALNNMEVRRSVAYGKFLKTLERVNEDDVWKSIFGTSHKRMAKNFLDLELVLRCFALYETKYNTQMKVFLNNYMIENKKSEKLEVAELFTTALHKIVSMLGKQEPFSPKKGRPNYALLDSTIVSVMKHIDNIPEDFAARFDNLINSEDYKNIFAPGQGTMSTKAVNDRLMKAEQILCL